MSLFRVSCNWYMQDDLSSSNALIPSGTLAYIIHRDLGSLQIAQ